MLEILKSIIKKFKVEPIYYVNERIPRTLGTPIRKK